LHDFRTAELVNANGFHNGNQAVAVPPCRQAAL